MIFLFFLQLLIASNSPQVIPINEGYAFRNSMSYDSIKKEYVLNRQLKYIFKDSSLIVGRDQLNRYTNMVTGETRTWMEVIGYTYIDLRTKSFFLYTTLTDTATITDSYLQPAEGRPKGGWGFFKKAGRLAEGFIWLNDTAINGVVYKRTKSFYPWEPGGTDTSWHEVYFFDCNNKTPFLNVGQASNGPENGVITRTESHIYRNGLRLREEIEVVLMKLTAEEEKVFAAWKRNASQHPVAK